MDLTQRSERMERSLPKVGFRDHALFALAMIVLIAGIILTQ